MNITDEDDRREISQLWFIALYYFERATEVKNKVDNKYLQKTVQEITDIYKKQSDPNCKKEIMPQDICKKIMLLNAHLASCAVRLNTIDEILGEKYTSARWYFYNGLLKKKDKLKEDDVTQNAEKIIHCILRHCVAHYETDLSSKKDYQTIEKTFRKFTIQFLHNNIESIMKEIEADISPAIQKYSRGKIDFNCC